MKKGVVAGGKLRELDSHLNMAPTASDELLTGCKFVSIQCEFSYTGCKAHMPRKDMTIHINIKQDHHIKLLAENVSMQNRQIEL